MLSTTNKKEKILSIALRVVAILKERGLSSFIVGSAAAALWGAPRLPNDVDLVVVTASYTPREGPTAARRADDAFYTVPSKNPRKHYRVLWHKPAGARKKPCKVDILVPPALNIPPVPAEHVVSRGGLPVAPLSLLLLLKLQGWHEYRNAKRRADLGNLLVIVKRERLDYAREEWLPLHLVAMGRIRASFFVCFDNPSSERTWTKIGLCHETAYSQAVLDVEKRRMMQIYKRKEYWQV